MAKFTLTIETDDPTELADITAAIAEEMSGVPPTGDALTQTDIDHAIAVLDKEPAKRKGRPPKASASVAETTEQAADPVVETSGESTLSTTASLSEAADEVVHAAVKAAGGEEVTAQDCKLALTAAMDRDVPPNKIQAALIEKFGGGSVMKIDPSRYAELKAYLESLTK